MKKKKIDLKKLFEPKDIVPIIAVIIGIVVAISYNELEIRLIGVCIFILGGVPLFISISTKLPTMIEKKYKPEQTPEYNINVIKQSNVIRMVIEDSEFTNNSEIIDKSDIDNEEFRIIKNVKSDVFQQDQSLKKKADEPKKVLNFSEGDSGVKIIGTFKTEDRSKQTEQAKETIESLETKTFDDKLEKDSKTKAKESEHKERPLKSLNIQINKEQKIQEELPANFETHKTNLKDYKEKQIEVPINLLLESEPIICEEPKKEFELFLQRILEAIRSVINTKTAIFCLVNFDKQELIIQAYSSDIKEAIVRKRKIPLGNDIVSQIVINRKPEILTEINPDAEVDLIPYYSVQTNTQSFIGMPVIYKKSVIGILCVDSTISDAYDSVTVNFLGQFTKLISALVHSYTEKYDLIQSAKILNVINAFKKVSYDKNLNIEDLYHSYIEILKTNFDFQTIGICSYNNHSGSWYISAYYTSLSDKNYEGLEIDPNEVLIGESILSYKTIFVSPLANDRIRVMKGENSLENGYFLSVPLKTYSYNYGALYVEGNNPTSFTNNEIYALEVLGEQIGGIIEQLFYSDALNVNNVFEAQTGILSTNSFLNRIIQELNRTNDFQGNFCLCHIRVDKYGAYYEEMFKDKSELIYQHILNIIKKYLKQYDILGKIDDNTFGIILVGMNLNQAQLWAERLRTEIAKTFLIIKTKRYNATVSIGIAEANNMTTLEEILSNCSKALDIASQKSNKVIIYQ